MTWHGWLTDERRARSTRILLLDGVTRRNIVWPNQTRPNTLPRKLARQIYMQSTVNVMGKSTVLLCTYEKHR